MKNIKEFRNKLGMSQSEFANNFNMSIRTLQGWETGRKVPEYVLNMIEKIVVLNNISIHPGSHVKVRLTNKGQSLYQEFNNDLNDANAVLYKNISGEIIMPLWKFIKLYGKFAEADMSEYIENNEIIITTQTE